MLTVEYNDAPPEVVIRIAGMVREGDLHEAVRRYAEGRAGAAGSVVLIEYVEESTLHPGASGVLLFLLERMMDAGPRAVLVVGAERLDTGSVAARELRERSVAEARIHFFATRAEAGAFIERLEREGPGA